MNVMAALNSAMPASAGPANAPAATAGATGLGAAAAGATEAGGNTAGGNAAAVAGDPGAQLLALLEALVPGGLQALGGEANGDATATDGLMVSAEGAEEGDPTDESVPLPSDPGLTASVFAALAGMARAQLGASPAGTASEPSSVGDPSSLSVGEAASGPAGVAPSATGVAAGSPAVASATDAVAGDSAGLIGDVAATVADLSSDGAVIELGTPAGRATVSAPAPQSNLPESTADVTESVDLTASDAANVGGNTNAAGEGEANGAGAESDSSLPRPMPINQVVAHRAATPAAEVQTIRSVDVPDQDPNVPRLTGAIRSMSRGGVQTTSLTLNPESLGAVRVDLHHQNGHLTVHLSAESAEGTQVLNRASGALRSELERSGLGATNVSVDVSTGGQQGRSTNWSADDSSSRGFTEPRGSVATSTVATSPTPTRSVSRPGRGAEGVDLSL